MTPYEHQAYHTMFDGCLIPGNFQIVSHTKCEAFILVAQLPLNSIRVGWRQNIATQRESMSSCFTLLFLLNSVWFFFSFHLQLCAFSILFRKKFLVNQFTLEFDYYSILFKILRNSWLKRFSFRSFIIVIRKRVLMPDSQVNCCRTAQSAWYDIDYAVPTAVTVYSTWAYT